MAGEEQDKIKWWHKAIGVIAIIALQNQIRGCFDSGKNKPTALNRDEDNGNLFAPPREDACSYILDHQYPYDWEGSNIGACVTKMPPTIVMTMVPDLTGTMLVPQQQLVRNRIRIQTPIGSGTGQWTGGTGNISGTLLTASGEVDFVCIGKETINSERGICGIPQGQ